MTARVGKQVKIVKTDDGKAKLVRKKGFATKRQYAKAGREERAWLKKSR